MTRERIDDIKSIDTSLLKCSDLRVLYGTFQSQTTGSGINKKRSSRVGVQTEIGDIREDIWLQLAEQVIMASGEEDIFRRLLAHIEAYPWHKNVSQAEKRREALKQYMARIFDNPGWVDFIPFNEPWRPEAFDGIEIINVVTACCQKAGRVTADQIKRYFENDQVFCPHCGRITEFQRV